MRNIRYKIFSSGRDIFCYLQGLSVVCYRLPVSFFITSFLVSGVRFRVLVIPDTGFFIALSVFIRVHPWLLFFAADERGLTRIFWGLVVSCHLVLSIFGYLLTYISVSLRGAPQIRTAQVRFISSRRETGLSLDITVLPVLFIL